MVNGLDGFSWFGLVVYIAVMGLVIKGVRIPIPLAIAKPLRALLVYMHLIDPLVRLLSDNRQDSIPPAPAPVKPAPGLRSRSESKIGLETVDVTPKSIDSLEGRDEMMNRQPRWSFVVDLHTAPVIGVIVLLATTTIDGSVMKLGLAGTGQARPYDVLVLFISLAYISTALDGTGILRSLAFLVSQRAARTPKRAAPSASKTASGPQLFSTLFWFWFGAGAIVGNDPIILSGTAFLAYFSRVTGITPPTAFIFSQFIAANAASAILVSSNPTNVLIAGAFELNFITGYTLYTVLPSVVAAILAYIISIFAFTFLIPTSRDPHNPHPVYIPAELVPPDVAPRSALLDPTGAIFHSSLMGLTLALLVGSSFIPGDRVQVWMVTAAAGIVAVSRDVLSEWKTGPAPTVIDNRGDSEVLELEEIDGRPAERPVIRRSPTTFPSILRKVTHRFPTTTNTISRLPLNLLPFAGGIFILSHSLTTLGWTSIFASWLAKICLTPAKTVFFIGYLTTFLLCPLCGTNIGATILLVEILRDPNFSEASHVLADSRILQGAIFSTAISSNLGAFSFTFSSSLAGLLWNSILLQKGIKVTAWEFAKWNGLFLPILSTAASAIVLLECYYF